MWYVYGYDLSSEMVEDEMAWFVYELACFGCL